MSTLSQPIGTGVSFGKTFREVLRGFLLHICTICSFIYIIAGVLDWYNPYMDFAGHTFGAQTVLCVCVILLSATKTSGTLRRRNKRKKAGRRVCTKK